MRFTFKQVKNVGLSKFSGNAGYSERTHLKNQQFETDTLVAFLSFLLSGEIETVCPEAGHDLILQFSYQFTICAQPAMSSDA